MSSCISAAFLRERIVKVKEMIVVYEDAIISIGTNNVQSYTLDTGQSRQTVTRSNLTELNNILESLYNLLATLYARLNGCGVVNVRGAW